jgi:hypothetical protein
MKGKGREKLAPGASAAEKADEETEGRGSQPVNIYGDGN